MNRQTLRAVTITVEVMTILLFISLIVALILGVFT